ncbi:MAG: SMC family ATPase, partial [Chloroflexi bacterium]|nr:SMC family ATPase [Chloroflexota bacterium]
LQAAQQSIVRVREAMEQQKQAEQSWRLLLERDRAERERLAVDLERRRTLLPQIEQAQRESIRLQQRVGQQQLLLGGLRKSLQHCDEQARLKMERQRELEDSLREKGVYEELTVAFGRKGIQAMIIGTAISELQDEANELLGRMTDEQMSLRFDMQRGTKKGDVVETLDILISDRLGTRDYGMFSGGEAFRINFAVRVALSKLLAHRAGARLETLVIDEGFGTQDEQGIDRLVQAIQAVQEDFSRILVITHIAELKERFPVRIDVTKTEDGSTFSIN